MVTSETTNMVLLWKNSKKGRILLFHDTKNEEGWLVNQKDAEFLRAFGFVQMGALK